ELPRSLAEFAQRLLSKRGVEVRLRTRLAGATAEAALLEGGERIATRTLVSTVSSVPNPLVESLPVKKERGRIVVDSHLAVPDYLGCGPWATAPLSLTGRAGSRVCRLLNTPSDRRGALRKTLWPPCEAWRRRGSRSQRSARWRHLGTVPQWARSLE